ncbi:unnamed protein product [Ranitomeya imitator]|uniref:Uncharacterized protein n=1 Tax=Ranitomeya imitator TaxID=111125 RepID=A0ABN9LKY4_9NEOB|nr:unnamed protein product [Ranitomeya imitator]
MSGGKKRSGFQITSVTTDYQPSSPVSPVPLERSLSPSPPNGLRSPPTSRFRLVYSNQPLITLTRSRGKGQQAPRSQGAPIFGAVPEKEPTAQDLVKTHLLFAVREEVEALREQIKDLTERNVVLEHENSLLRTLATPQQLSEVNVRIQMSRKPL